MRHVLFVCCLSTFWPSVNAVFDPLCVFVMGPVIGKKAVKLLFFFNFYYVQHVLQGLSNRTESY